MAGMHSLHAHTPFWFLSNSLLVVLSHTILTAHLFSLIHAKMPEATFPTNQTSL